VFKARFTVSVVRAKKDSVLSNMLMASSKPFSEDDDLVSWRSEPVWRLVAIPKCYCADDIKKILFQPQLGSCLLVPLQVCYIEYITKNDCEVIFSMNQGLGYVVAGLRKEGVIFCPKLLDVFETTPRMSTYALGLAIGEFTRTSAVDNKGVVVSVLHPWASSGAHKTSAGDAVKNAIRFLQFFEGYFRGPYPLQKLGKYILLFHVLC
jgi:hypothetical protein